jgi:hypothetical protein
MRSIWKWGLLPLVLAVIALGLSACHPAQSSGIWLDNSTLDNLSQNTSAFNSLEDTATASNPFEPVCDQDSQHDTRTLAKALYGVATDNANMQFGAISSIAAAVGTEEDHPSCGSSGSTLPRWLSVGRNLGAYVIAADVLRSVDVVSASVDGWFADFLDGTITLQNNNNPGVQEPLSTSAWNTGANASAQQGFVRSALAAYLGNDTILANEFLRFRKYVGDRTSTWDLEQTDATQDTWQRVPADPVGIVEPGPTKNGCRWDGAVAWDMARTGAYSCTPDFDNDGQYPWVGLEGAIPAAMILQRQGFHAFEAVTNAINRSLDFLWDVRQRTGDARWFDGSRGNDVIQLVNHAYGENHLFVGPAGNGRTVGWTDWTHP